MKVKRNFDCEGVMQRRTGKRRMRAVIDGVVKQNKCSFYIDKRI